MKKETIFLAFLIISFLIEGCNNNCSKKEFKEAEDILEIREEIDTSLNAIRPLFLDKINDFIFYTDSLQVSTDIILVLGYRDNENSYIMITSSNHYDTQTLLGYVIIESRLVAFCCPYERCSRDFFDISKMRTNKIIKGFENEKSEDIWKTDFDPINHLYLIHNKDSLELISKGMW